MENSRHGQLLVAVHADQSVGYAQGVDDIRHSRTLAVLAAMGAGGELDCVEEISRWGHAA